MKHALAALTLSASFLGALGCSEEPKPVSDDQLEERLEQHREMSNREQQDIQGK